LEDGAKVKNLFENKPTLVNGKMGYGFKIIIKNYFFTVASKKPKTKPKIILHI